MWAGRWSGIWFGGKNAIRTQQPNRVTWVLARESRTLVIDGQSRDLILSAEARHLCIAAEHRALELPAVDAVFVAVPRIVPSFVVAPQDRTISISGQNMAFVLAAESRNIELAPEARTHSVKPSGRQSLAQ